MTEAERQRALHATEVEILQAVIRGHEDSLMKLFSRVEHLLTQYPDPSPLRNDLERFVRSEQSIYLGDH